MRGGKTLRILWLLLPISFLYPIAAYERIVKWDSDITVFPDAHMRVTDRIIVNAEGLLIRHGIKRDFPTQYKSPWGLRYVVPFNVQQVLLDGHPVAYEVVAHDNGHTAYIGEKQGFVTPGIHEYVMTYETDRQLGFFDNYDELYWNVTGNDSPFEIEKLTVRAHIPKTTLQGSAVPLDKLHIEAYTGRFGSRAQDYRAYIGQDGVGYWTITGALHPHEGFTIVMNWPKGVVRHVSRFWIYVKENLHLAILLMALLCICLWYIFAWVTTRRQIKYGTVIPLFYPPHDAGPGAIRYISRMKYDSTCLAANIVQMAVRGLLIIEYVPGAFWSSSHYLLKKRQNPSATPTRLESSLLQILFGSSDICTLTSANNVRLSNAGSAVSHTYELDLAINNFQSHSEYVSFAAIFTLIATVIGLLFVPVGYFDVLFWLALFLHAIVHITMYVILPTYSQAGQKFKDEIDGFKMFLTTTETERLKLIGTPPTRTPELYETYLPYAIALGVEQQWSTQFASVFKGLEQAGHAYQPTWYYAGHPFMASDLAFLNASFGRSLNQALTLAARPISSSSTPPGSSSGSGGQGHSGGGGGGGGVGGW